MDKKYAFLLDLYPLLTVYPPEAALLVMRLEQCVFNLIMGEDCFDQLKTCLELSKDLGYIDDRLFSFLERRAEQLV